MISVQSFACGKWIDPNTNTDPIIGPVTGVPIAQVGGYSFEPSKMIEYAKSFGGGGLREMTFHQRAKIVKSLAMYLDTRKEELYTLSTLTGATRRDGWIDIDGGIGTLLAFASKGRREMPDGYVYLDGEIEQLSRKGTFLGQHIAVPLQGVAVQINAFNFPIWGMLEKLAPAILAGVPSIIKPATQTCYLTEACFRMMIESGLLPEGAIQLIIGRPGDLIDRLGPQDIVSFTGSAKTAFLLRSNPNILRNSVRFMAEQDSLNASILGPDAVEGTPEFSLFIKEVVTEMTVKAGQKCTAIRRIIVPADMVGPVGESLSCELEKVTVGNPSLKEIHMGALASLSQKKDILECIKKIGSEATMISGNPEKFDVVDGDPSQAFLPPMLFSCADPDAAREIHEVEAFGPVATLLPYRDISHAADLANRGKGSLVASVITHDPKVARDITLASAAWHGRLYFNNRDSMAESTGHGSPLPHMTHGGPGRAGGGEELGGVRGILHYMQRTAIQGSPDILTSITGQWINGARELEGPTHPFQRTFNEIEIGETLHTKPRTITIEDIEKFAHFTGDTFYAHMDEDAARANPFFPGRVAHGYLLLSFAAGLFVQPDPGPVLANTGLNALSFQKPISPGDSIRVRLTAARKTQRTKNYGEVAWNATLYNQNNEQVAQYELLTMVSYGR